MKILQSQRSVKRLSASHSPIAGPMFSVPLVLASLVAQGAVIQGKLFSEIATSSSITAVDVANETSAFVSEGASLGVFATKELGQGLANEFVHGVKEGARLFTALIGGSEVIFERCGVAIVGRYADGNQEPITEDVARRIDESYQKIIREMTIISTGNDKVMVEHQERMEQVNRELKLTEISNQTISKELDQLKIQEQEMQEKRKASLEQAKLVEAKETQIRLQKVTKELDKSLEELRKKISESDQKAKQNQIKALELAELQEKERAQGEHLDQRKAQSLEYLETHSQRIRIRTDAEIQRLVKQHGIENPNINIDTNESGQIRVVIEQN